MKVATHSLLFVFLTAFFCRCDRSSPGEPLIRSLDSLSGVVGSMVKELERLDTLTLQKAVNRYNYYRAFVRQNVNDTLQKPEADALRGFFSAGATLQTISVNNKLLRSRGQLLGGQIARLSKDLKDRKGMMEAALRNYERERGETERLIQTGTQQQQEFHTAMESFRNALPQVEGLIRRHNRGQLPVIVKDSVQL